jgi:hypothetical protein
MAIQGFEGMCDERVIAETFNITTDFCAPVTRNRLAIKYTVKGGNYQISTEIATRVYILN